MAVPTIYDPRGRAFVAVDFGVLIDGQVVPCSISFEALADHFKSESDASSMVKSYVENRERIDAKATAIYRLAQQSGAAHFTNADRLSIKTAYL